MPNLRHTASLLRRLHQVIGFRQCCGDRLFDQTSRPACIAAFATGRWRVVGTATEAASTAPICNNSFKLEKAWFQTAWPVRRLARSPYPRCLPIRRPRRLSAARDTRARDSCRRLPRQSLQLEFFDRRHSGELRDGGLPQNCNLSGVIKLVLRYSHQHVTNGVIAVGHYSRPDAIREAQPRRHTVSSGRPADLPELSATLLRCHRERLASPVRRSIPPPVHAFFAILPASTQSGDSRFPTHYERCLPDENWRRAKLTAGNNSIKRRSMPGIALKRAPDLVGDPLHFRHLFFSSSPDRMAISARLAASIIASPSISRHLPGSTQGKSHSPAA